MDISAEIMTLSTSLANIIANKSVQTIFDRVKLTKEKDNKEETIQKLEDIINELIDDKNNLIRISQAFEEKLSTQKITESEIEYITSNIIPILESFLDKNDNANSQQIKDSLDICKKILSKEVINVFQILGFNFKKALGEPLTELVASIIKSKIQNNNSQELQLTSCQRDIEYFKLLQDEDAFQRLSELNNK